MSTSTSYHRRPQQKKKGFLRDFSRENSSQMLRRNIHVRWFFKREQERPYHDDSTASRLLSEDKHHRARLVLRWGTTLESRVLFFLSPILRHCMVPELPLSSAVSVHSTKFYYQVNEESGTSYGIGDFSIYFLSSIKARCHQNSRMSDLPIRSTCTRYMGIRNVRVILRRFHIMIITRQRCVSGTPPGTTIIERTFKLQT